MEAAKKLGQFTQSTLEPGEIARSGAPKPPKRQRGGTDVERAGGRTRRRVGFYMPDKLADKLAVFCAKTRQEQSSIVSNLVKQFLQDKKL